MSNRLLGDALVVVHIGVVFIPRAWQRPHCTPAICPVQGEARSQGPGRRHPPPWEPRRTLQGAWRTPNPIPSWQLRLITATLIPIH